MIGLFRPNYVESINQYTAGAYGRDRGAEVPDIALACPEGWLKIAVVGAHLTGMPLNPELTSVGGICLAETRSTPDYRLYVLPDTVPPKPGLIRDPGFAGPGIALEVWALPPEAFGTFIARIPTPLGVGKVTLETGEAVTGFLCESHALRDAPEITVHGGWKAWLANRETV